MSASRPIEFKELSWSDFAKELRRRYEEEAKNVKPSSPTPPADAPTVFLCHCSEDREQVEAVGERLALDHLRLHPRKAHISRVSDGLNLLGCIVFPTHRRLHNDNGYRFRRRLHRIARAYARGLVEPFIGTATLEA